MRSIGKSWTGDYQDHVISWTRDHDMNGTQQKSPGPRPTPIPSGILIHAAILPQQIWAGNLGGCWAKGRWVPI